MPYGPPANSTSLFRELSEAELELQEAERKLRWFSDSDRSHGAEYWHSRAIDLRTKVHVIRSRLDSLQPPPPEVPPAPVSDPGEGTANPPAPSKENTPRSQEDQPDPLTQTLEVLSRGTRALELINYLDEVPSKTRKLRDVSKRIYRNQSKPTLAKTGTLIRRTRDILEKRKSPMRIDWDPEKGKVTLLKTSSET